MKRSPASNVKPLPPQDYLVQRLRYEEHTGLLFWKRCSLKPNAWNGAWAGKQAFTAKNKAGYKHGTVDQKGYLAHRIIWKIAHGHDPDVIDHINGDRADNRLENLRNIQSWENQKNMALMPTNTSTVSGVHYSKVCGKWCARIGAGGENLLLGYFAEFGEAVAARRGAEIALGYHPGHGRRSRNC